MYLIYKMYYNTSIGGNKRNMKDIKKSKDYLSNKEMYQEVIECQKEGKMSDKLGKMFILLAERYSTKPNFSGYSYRDEMVSNAILACCQAFMKFNPDKGSNTFAYFTSVIHNAFIQILNKERRNQEIRDECLIEMDRDPSSSYLERYKNNNNYEENTNN